jgi:hypothetical protein
VVSSAVSNAKSGANNAVSAVSFAAENIGAEVDSAIGAVSSFVAE